MKSDIATLDALAARLRQTEPAVADGNFTAAVMAQLPPTNVRPTWLRDGLLLGATALGSAIVAWQTPLPAVASLLDAVSTNFQALTLAGVGLTYGAAFAAVWVANRY